MRIAHLGPLPPVRSGIAHYAGMLLPALARRAEVTAVVETQADPMAGVERVISFDEYQGQRDEFDIAIYQLGNNPHHEWVYREALRFPGVVVLHEIVLHHLIVEITLARGDVEGYVRAMRENHGEAGAAWAEARAAGLHMELSNFLFPASRSVANASRAVIVQNGYAATRLRDTGVTVPIKIVRHPYVAEPSPPFDIGSLRETFGFETSNSVIGVFGFVTTAKRPDVIFEAFGRAIRRDPNLRLLIVGEPAPNVDLEDLARQNDVGPTLWRSTGYVGDDAFDQYIEVVDRVVNLRYPSAGETSGALLRVLHKGKPVVVNDYAQFAEYPRSLVTKIPFGDMEVEALAGFMLDPSVNRPEDIQGWFAANASVETAAEGYLSIARSAIEGAERSESVIPIVTRSPAIPSIGLRSLRSEFRDGATLVVLTIANEGEETIRASVWGEPAYRLIVKAMESGAERADQWVELPGDLLPGSTAELEISFPVSLDASATVELFHALEGIPTFDVPPFAAVGITG